MVFKPNGYLTVYDKGSYYQNVVNQILKEDIFKSFKFYREKNGVLDFRLDHYNFNNIAPDFFI